MCFVFFCITALVSLKASASEIGEYSALENDFFTEHLQNHINNSIDPCDNFYRHVCSRTKMHDPIGYINQMSKEISEMDPEEDPKLVQLLSFCEEHKERSNRSVCQRLLTGHQSVRVRRYLHKHGYDTEEFLAKFVAIADEIRSRVGDQLEKQFQFSAATREELNALFNRTEISLFRYLNLTVQQFESEYNQFAEMALTLNTSELLEPSRIGNKRTYIPKFNACYRRRNGLIYVHEGHLMLLLKADECVTRSVLGNVLGHEMHHALVATRYGAEDPAYQRKHECVKKYALHTCGLFNEETKLCGGGNDTIDEDAPDYEALHAAYLTYAEKYKDLLEEKYLNDITYKQLFFYSEAASSCFDHEARENYSSSYLRINGVFALADSFQEAFQCKEHSRMAKLAAAAGPDKCNFFGDTVRR